MIHTAKHSTIGAIVLAAGLSSRMGQFKLLLKWLDDKPILEYIVAKVMQLDVAQVVVVTGNRADDVKAALENYDVTFAHNPDYATGEILSSMKVGLQAIQAPIQAALVIPGDLPRIPLAVMQQVINAHAEQTIVAPRHDGQRGHPVLFDKYFWQALLDLPPDKMPRDVLQAHKDKIRLIDVASDGINADVDTPEIYERELRRAQAEAQSTD